MISRDSSLEEIKDVVKSCLSRVYDNDADLFNRNSGKCVSERCIVFRFAHYLQKELTNFYVDCDFNSSYHRDPENGWEQKQGKPIENPDGTTTNRFVDIIIHKRSNFKNNAPNYSDFLCFEIKKWNNYNKEQNEKDENNLKDLTSRYGYVYGFHISFHRVKSKTKWTIYKDGIVYSSEENVVVFQNEPTK